MNNNTRKVLGASIIIVAVIVFLGIALYLPGRDADKTSESKSYHYSSRNSLQYFSDIYENSKIYATTDRPKAVIVNHHLFAPLLIANALETAKINDAPTIVIISPDHFSAGRTDITISKYFWSTPYGDIDPALTLADTMLLRNSVSVNEEAFAEEHGISNLVGFVKHAYPNSKIVPVLIKDGTPISELDKLADTITTSGASVIGSFDFTHYQDVATSRVKDTMTIKILKEINPTKYQSVTADSKEGVYLLLKVVSLKMATGFELFENTSAAELLNDFNTKDNTSYITGIFY